MSLVELLYDVDDFCQLFEPFWEQHLLKSNVCQRCHETQLSTSEIMTILIHFHDGDFKHFKVYYTHVREHLMQDFPVLVSYKRFVILKKRVGITLYVHLYHCMGISCIDSTKLTVCHNRHIAQHRVFEGVVR